MSQEVSSVPVITVDGPGGTGKGTVAAMLANHLSWNYLESGVIYRALAYLSDKKGISLDDVDRLTALAAELPLRFCYAEASSAYEAWLEDKEVSEALHTEQMGNRASKIGAFPEVRFALLGRQRAFRSEPGLVTDGRDMGTVVFPDACLKIFLTASSEARAQRRCKQLMEKGIHANLAELQRELSERDARDAARAVAPMLPAPDAVVIDTTLLSVSVVFDRLLDLVHRQGML